MGILSLRIPESTYNRLKNCTHKNKLSINQYVNFI
jgi:predicted HicB family RNase H-like nuclease